MNFSEVIIELALLKKELSFHTKELAVLRKENAELKERLSKYENPKNSSNSSIPPSQDKHRIKSNQSLRRSSGKSQEVN